MQKKLKEIYHKQFNLEGIDNISSIPRSKALFGIFAIVEEQPANCRYISVAENLQSSLIKLFEDPVTQGMKKFMQGSWVKMIVYKQVSNLKSEKIYKIKLEWDKLYKPDIDDDGEYPGY